MNKTEAEITMDQYKHLLCKVFEHKGTKLKMKLTFMQVDKDADTGKYKVNCFADGAYGHIIEELNDFLVDYSPIQNRFFQ